MRLRRVLKRLAITVGVGALVVVALVGYVGYSLIADDRYKTELQRVAHPDGRHEFVLLSDKAGFGDPAWYVYELGKGLDLSPRLKEAHNTEGSLFWNYSEDGGYSDAPLLEVRSGRYLVFTRGGRFHSLYDIPDRRVLVNEESPWASYSELAMSKQDRWVIRNLHEPIQRILSRGQLRATKTAS